MRSHLAPYLELCKIRVAALSSFSAVLGYLLASPKLRPEIAILFAGVFLLACGALALNQYQERELDGLMPRTLGRPLPSGRMKPLAALCFALTLLLAGFLILFATGSLSAVIPSSAALFFYNGAYTFLKKKTLFALLPGAVAGAIPPAIGWSAAGGSWSDPGLAALLLFFFIWQIPHSWVLMASYGKEYEEAGLPTVTAIFSPAQIRRIILHWFLALASGVFLISLLGLVHYVLIQAALLVWTLWLLGQGVWPFISGKAASAPFLNLKGVNYYLAGVLFLLSGDKLLFLS